jgi:hypothetical protein
VGERKFLIDFSPAEREATETKVGGWRSPDQLILHIFAKPEETTTLNN